MTISPLTPARRAENRLSVAALLLAPLVLKAATFYWKPEGGLSVTGGLLTSLAFVFWVMVFRHLFSRLRDQLPNYAAWGFLVATIGCFAGNNFGFLGLLESAIQIPEAQQRAGMEQHAGAFVATLFVPGLLFPLSLLVLGIQLIRARQVPLWVGILLCLGAIGFPASRIGRIQALAHIDDVVLLVACGTLAWQLIRQPATPVTAPVPAAATV